VAKKKARPCGLALWKVFLLLDVSGGHFGLNGLLLAGASTQAQDCGGQGDQRDCSKHFDIFISFRSGLRSLFYELVSFQCNIFWPVFAHYREGNFPTTRL
jgi:hypothetical protein